jgi:hypothetical protein
MASDVLAVVSRWWTLRSKRGIFNNWATISLSVCWRVESGVVVQMYERMIEWGLAKNTQAITDYHAITTALQLERSAKGLLEGFDKSHMWDFKFSRRRVWSSDLSSGMYCILHGSTSQKTNMNFKSHLVSHNIFGMWQNLDSAKALQQSFPNCPNYGECPQGGAVRPVGGESFFVWGTNLFWITYWSKIKYIFWQALCLAEIWSLLHSINQISRKCTLT